MQMEGNRPEEARTGHIDKKSKSQKFSKKKGDPLHAGREGGGWRKKEGALTTFEGRPNWEGRFHERGKRKSIYHPEGGEDRGPLRSSFVSEKDGLRLFFPSLRGGLVQSEERGDRHGARWLLVP